MAGQRLDQEGEGKAAGHVGVEIWFCRTERAEAPGGGCLGGGHDGRGDGPDFHADAAWEGAPIPDDIADEELLAQLGIEDEAASGITTLRHVRTAAEKREAEAVSRIKDGTITSYIYDPATARLRRR